MDENIRKVTHVQNIRYDKAAERLYIIDQTLLPNEEREIELRTPEEMVEAIKKLRIRGAPAIGICAGYCLYRLARDIDAKDTEVFLRKLSVDAELLGAARPTAVNLRWALGEMMKTAQAHRSEDREALLNALYQRAVAIHEDDIAKCKAISEYGLSLLHEGDGVLTHCNAGPLATFPIRHGTGAVLFSGGAWHEGEGIRRRDPSAFAGRPAHQLRIAAGKGGCDPYLRQHGLYGDEKRLGAGLLRGL